MSVLTKTTLGIALCLVTAVDTSWGQQSSLSSQSEFSSESEASTGSYGPLSKEDILQSSRWRSLRRSFENWLSVQKVYSPTEVQQLKASLDPRISNMSVGELEDFIYDSEDRLNALMSDEAMDARAWLSFLTPEAREKQLARLGPRTNVFDMSGGQLRQDLRKFEQLRGSQGAAQEAHNQGQQQRARDAREDRQARDEAQIDARARMAEGVQRRHEAQNSPYRPLPVGPTNWDANRPGMWVNPWGGISRRMW